MTFNNKILFGILFVTLIALLIFIVYQNTRKGYICTEDGCQLNPFGKFKSKQSCDDNCNNQHLEKKVDHSNPKLSNKPTPTQNKPTPTQNKPTPTQSKPKVQQPVQQPVQPVQPQYAVQNQESGYINYNNVRNVQEQIKRKKHPTPYYATTQQSTEVITDYDTFPYPRYFKGIPESIVPIVAEREAGWRARHDNAYAPKIKLDLTPDCVVGSLAAQLEQVTKENCNDGLFQI